MSFIVALMDKIRQFKQYFVLYKVSKILWVVQAKLSLDLSELFGYHDLYYPFPIIIKKEKERSEVLSQLCLYLNLDRTILL